MSAERSWIHDMVRVAIAASWIVTCAKFCANCIHDSSPSPTTVDHRWHAYSPASFNSRYLSAFERDLLPGAELKRQSRYEVRRSMHLHCKLLMWGAICGCRCLCSFVWDPLCSACCPWRSNLQLCRVQGGRACGLLDANKRVMSHSLRAY